MKYCSNCGKIISNGEKICSNCGFPIDYKEKTKRKEEYAGKIVKCPACGTEIPSFTAFCPGCGHEINSAEVSPVMKDFVKQLNKCDKAIVNSPIPPKKGFSSWSTSIKIIWVLVNFMFFGIPLVIYLSFPFLGIGPGVYFTREEKNKAQVINNYPFPNDRKSIIESLLYIKEQVRSLASGKKDRKTYQWLKIWKNKAMQLFERAEIMFPGDEIVSDTYFDIENNVEKVKKSLFIRLLAGVFVVLIYSFLVLFGNKIPFFNKDNDYNLNNTFDSSDSSSSTTIEDSQTDSSNDIYTYPIKNYVGLNLANIGEENYEGLVDTYGDGRLRINIVNEKGKYIPLDSKKKRQYVVVDQNIKEGTNLVVVEKMDYAHSVSFQSYDEIILYVSRIKEKGYSPTIIEILPTLDRHIYHIRDYVGRNAASIGQETASNRIDKYGPAEIRITYKTKDGSFIDTDNVKKLNKYVVVKQDISPNTELKLEFDKDDSGNEDDYYVVNQNYEEIILTVKKIKSSIFPKLPFMKK